MAPIIQTNATNFDFKTNLLDGSWIATICLMAGMIVSLVGIKIWWFKHRLTFDQNASGNSAAGGSQQFYRSTVKDKRASQQVCESVVVHGVFRKRQEDELDIVDRPKQLPPIRIPERSQSTSALLPPPRTKRGNITPDIQIPEYLLEPPTREPPKPPNSLIETVSEDVVDIVDGNNVRPNVVNSTTESLAAVAQQSSPLELEFEKVKISEQQKVPTLEFTDEQNEPHPLFEKVKPQKNKENDTFENSNSSTRALPAEQYVTNFLPYVDLHDEISKEDSRPTMSIKSAQIEDVKALVHSKISKDTEIEPIFHIDQSNNWSNNAEETWESNYPHVPQSTLIKDTQYQIENNSQNTDFFDDNSTFMRTADNEHIWQEMGVAIEANNFTRHIEDEFDKIRHSYQAHEEDFLELNENVFEDKKMESANKTPDFDKFSGNFLQVEADFPEQFNTVGVVAQSPTGFGKNIEDDWENFQNLHSDTKDFDTIEFSDTPITITTTTLNTDNTEEFEDFVSPNLLSSATAYVQSIEELYDEISDSEEEIYDSKITEQAEAEATFNPTPKASILKEHLQSFNNLDKATTPTTVTRKLKSQQKVTFDTNTEEYYLPENSETESEDEYGAHERDDDYMAKKTKRHTYYNQNQLNDYYDNDVSDNEDYEDVYEDYGNENVVLNERKNSENVHYDTLQPPLPITPAPRPMQRTTTTATSTAQYFNSSNEEIEENDVLKSITTTTTTTKNTWSENSREILQRTKFQEFEKNDEEIDLIQKHYQQQQQHQQKFQYQQQKEEEEKYETTTAALLFSTQISLDDETTGDDLKSVENDSWTAIRQRRYRHEQYEQHEEQHTEVEEQHQYHHHHHHEMEFLQTNQPMPPIPPMPRASPRLGNRLPNSEHFKAANFQSEFREPAPRAARRPSRDEVGATAV